jgi:hypothetical protein
MEKNFGLTELTQNELMVYNGGWAQSIIASFLASNCVKRLVEFVDGFKEGYSRGTANP